MMKQEQFRETLNNAAAQRGWITAVSAVMASGRPACLDARSGSRDGLPAITGGTPAIRFTQRFLRCFSRAIRICALPFAALFAVSASAANISWNGAADAVWSTGGNWVGGVAPVAVDTAVFDASSTANLTTTLGADFSIQGLRITTPGGLITIGAGNMLTLGSGGIDMSVASQNLVLNALVALAANQSWNVANGRTLTANGAISGVGVNLNKIGLGDLILGGANTFTGTTTIGGGTLTLNGSLNGTTGTDLTFAGSGIFNVSAASGVSQGMKALSFSGGEGAVRSTNNGGTSTVSFTTRIARAAGATGNFSLVNGTQGAGGTNNIAIGGELTGRLMDRGLFYNGSSYAAYDAGGFVRGLIYGTDLNAPATIATGATLGVNDATKDVQISGNITAQTTASVNTIRDPGNFAITLAGGQTLSLNGILKSGGNAATISGGAGITTTVSGNELVIRTDAAGDSLAINTPILANGSNGLTKSGAGTLSLGNAHTYAGATVISGGTLKLAVASGAPTTPVAGYARWFDASTIAGANGASISTWNDLSGNNANATVPGGSNTAPTLVSNAGTGTGLSALHFNTGTNPNPAIDSQALTFLRDTNVRTVFSIFKGSSFLITDSDNYGFHRPGDTNPADPLLVNFNNGDAPALINGSTYVNGAQVNPLAFAMPTNLHNGFNLISMTTDGTAVAVNGFNKDRFIYHSGDQSQAEVLIYDFALDNTQRLAVEAYLNAKWFGIGINTPVTPAGSLPSTTPLSIAAGAAFDLNGNNQQIFSLTGTSGASVTNSGANDSILTVSGTSNTSFDGVISNGATKKISLTKSGVGTLTLTGANTYTGVTIVNGGVLQIGNAGTTGSLGTGNTTLTSPGNLIFNRTDAAYSYGGVISGSGSLTHAGSGTTTLTGANAYTGVTTLTDGVLSVATIGNGGASGNLGKATNAAANLVFNGGTLKYTGATASTDRNFTINAGKTATFDITANNLTVYGASTATNGGITKIGAGTLTLGNAHTYAGATVISGGTLKLAVASGPPTAPVAGYARWFDASTIAGANGASISTWNDLSGNNANATVPGGSNTAPTLVSNAGTGTGLSALLFNGPVTSANTSQALTFTRDSSIRSVFSIFKGSSFLLTDTPENSYQFHRLSDNNAADPLLVNYGQLGYLGSVYVNGTAVDGTTFAMPTTLHGGFNLVEVITNGNSLAADSFNKDRAYHSGVQSQAEVLIYDFVLDNTQRLAVEAYLNAKWFGIATNTPAGSLPSTTPLSIATGAAFDLNGVSQQVFSLTGTSGASVTNSGATDSILTVSGTTSTIFGGVISDGATKKISFVKSGTNTLTLSGPNTYTGTTTLSAGTLVVSGSISGSTTTVSSGGTLVVSGTLSGSTTTVNAGTLVVSGTLSGSTMVNSGSTLTGEGGMLGNVTVNNGGTLSPGANSAGTLNTGALTFAAGGVFKFEVNSDTPALDLVNISGDLNITSGAVMSVSDLGSTVFGIDYFGVPFPILDYTGACLGTFAGLPDGSIFTIGPNTYQIYYSGADPLNTTAVTLTILAVPEPGTAVSLLGGLGLLLGMRRRPYARHAERGR